MVKINKIERIEKIEKELIALKKEVASDNEKQIDFSKWIGRSNDILAIKGVRLLKSYNNIELGYVDSFRSQYNDLIQYEVVIMDDLKEGDIFIQDNAIFDNISVTDFRIYMGRDDDYDYRYTYLYSDSGFERILSSHTPYNTKVKRFLRE